MRTTVRALPAAVLAAGLVVLSSPAASAASSAWTKVGSCTLHTVRDVSVAVISSSSKVTADDGDASGSVGLSAKTATTTSSAVFAATSITITGRSMTHYKVWH
ncbi:hypothetical protein [Cellulomonas olei]|uniref:hypothetical protein n=1 Tax=Cellulomonas sp. P4 TaxID=3142533 RepID=UPI0031BBB47A